MKKETLILNLLDNGKVNYNRTGRKSVRPFRSGSGSRHRLPGALPTDLAKNKGLDLTIIVDIIHVIEYLWAAGRAFHPESGQELENWVRHRLLEILHGKAGLMAGGMRRSATRRKLSKDARKPVDTCARYLLNNADYLRYDRYLAKGLPIATGVIEGACRHLVKDRMDVTGARWSLSGAEAVLRLRALRSSHDFDEYWKHHEQCEYERNHKALYKNGVVPPTIDTLPSRRRAHLKVIKETQDSREKSTDVKGIWGSIKIVAKKPHPFSFA